MLRVVHLPVYSNNRYQPELMGALRAEGLEVIDGGSGGTFARTALRTWKPDLLHLHWIHPYVVRPTLRGSLLAGLWFLLTLQALRLRGTKIVWTVHNLQNHAGQQPVWERWVSRRLYGRCDATLVHCSGAVELARRAWRLTCTSRMVVVPHASYVGSYPDGVTREEARRSLELTDAAAVVVFIGRIEAYKGVLDLLAAFRKVAGPRDALVIAGAIGDPAQLEQLWASARATPRTTFTPGYVDDPKVQVFLRAASVVVCPYRAVLTSGSVLLAASFGRPCIAPRVGCIPETLPDQPELLYPAEEPAGLETALAWALRHADRLDELGRRNFERASAWGWPEMARATHRVYQTVCAGVRLGTSGGVTSTP